MDSRGLSLRSDSHRDGQTLVDNNSILEWSESEITELTTVLPMSLSTSGTEVCLEINDSLAQLLWTALCPPSACVEVLLSNVTAFEMKLVKCSKG